MDGLRVLGARRVWSHDHRVNLAEELHRERRSPVLLVDMDLDYGSVASYLGIEHQYGLTHVLAEGEKIDPQLVSSSAATYHEGFQVLPSPATVDPAGKRAVDFEHLDRTIDACKQAYAFTIVDAPRASVECAVKLASASTVVLVVFELSVIDVRAARNTINELVAQGLQPGVILPVANRYKKRSPMLAIRDAEKALGVSRIVTVRNDFESVIRSVNLGEPLARIAPRSPARKDIRGLLQNIDAGSASAA